jgi:hypothetical protein
MKKFTLMLATAALGLGGAIAAASTPAQAQVGIEIGPGGPRVYQERPYRPVVERRHVERRVIVEDDAEDCRVEVRRRINRFGERVVTRTRICD